MPSIDIYPPDDGEKDWSVFEDLTSHFWPGDEAYEYDNHDVQERIVAAVRRKYGDAAVRSDGDVRLPEGQIQFDCEAGGCNFYGDEAAVRAMVTFVQEILAERDLLRDRLR